MQEEKRLRLREFLKDSVRREVDFQATRQAQGEAMPPVEKPLPLDSEVLALPAWEGQVQEADRPLSRLIGERMSLRRFADSPLSLPELAYLLWATQGVRRQAAGRVLRNVPSAGNRHALETYVAVRQVTGLAEGIYLYRPLSQCLVQIKTPDRLSERLTRAASDQPFVGRAPCTLIWTALPERMEWRYAEASVKVIALDAGHVCQNLYLAAQSIGCGTCAVAAYDQEEMDKLLGLDGEDEFVVYLAPVGHRP